MKKTNFPKFLKSLTAVIIPMMILLAAFVIDAGVLFYRAFPYMPDGLRLAASAFLGFALAFPLLLTAINSKLLPTTTIKGKHVGFPELFAVFTAFMTAMFFDVFNAEGKHWSWYVLVAFLSIGLGLVDWLYASLFVNKDYQENEQIDYKEKYEAIAHTPGELSECKKTLEETRKALIECKKRISCRHCGEPQKSYSALRTHEGRCGENPKNQDL
ncbi:hypothetical protein [Ekhidna sp.]|jgi:hypothetical protein|uniref:hypothetical protein n=1 Tax=Ekhidna sp. TaxID=2608089 RepID=UPI0032ED20A0